MNKTAEYVRRDRRASRPVVTMGVLLILVMMGGVLPAEAVADYSSSDLAGTWYNHALAAGAGAPWWEWGPITVDADGNFSGTVQQYGDDPDEMSGQLQIDPNGAITIVGAPQDPTANGFHHAHMALDKNVISHISTWSTGSPGTTEISILTRQGSDYQTSDVAGTWHLHGLYTGSQSDWMNGLLVVQSNGLFSGTVGEHDNLEAVSGQIQIDSNGVITLVGGDADNHITMAANKNTIVQVLTSGDADQHSELMVWTRAAAQYATSDLAGTWYLHQLASGAEDQWWYGRMDVLADGSYTGTGRSSEGVVDSFAGQGSVDAGGVVTFADGAASDPNHAHLSADKNVIVMAQSWGDDTSALMVFTRGASTGRMPVYRFWSALNSRHFYTIALLEKDYVIATYPSNVWAHETVAYNAFASNSEPGLAPVYRFWSNALSAHFYTISEAERDLVMAMYPDVWTYEGPVLYAYPEGSQPLGASPVYRFWSATLSTHFYTISESEKDYVIANLPAWQYETIAWYAYE